MLYFDYLFSFLVYYKTIPFFIFVFDAQKKNSFEKIKKVIQNINTISKDKKLNGILVAINADTKIEYVKK